MQSPVTEIDFSETQQSAYISSTECLYYVYNQRIPCTIDIDCKLILTCKVACGRPADDILQRQRCLRYAVVDMKSLYKSNSVNAVCSLASLVVDVCFFRWIQKLSTCLIRELVICDTVQIMEHVRFVGDVVFGVSIQSKLRFQRFSLLRHP